MKKNNKKGFTLVELVIVIAVIAILAAVLIPTFGNVIGNAKKAAAQSDATSLHSSILANIDYANEDFDDWCAKHFEDGALKANDAFFSDYANKDVKITFTAATDSVKAYITYNADKDGVYYITENGVSENQPK